MSDDQVTVETRIAADAEQLYDLVTDVPRMSEWSPENTSCRWLRGATGPATGARFKGANRDGWRRWSTTCTVVTAVPGREFTFDVDFAKLPVSRWTYEFNADGNGTLVRESWTDRRRRWMIRISPVVMGVKDRAGHNRDGMRQTLAALTLAAEATKTP